LTKIPLWREYLYRQFYEQPGTFENDCCGESPAGRLKNAKGYFSGDGFLPGQTVEDFLE